MKLTRLQMGCLSSRSTIAPADRVEQVTTSQKIKLSAGQTTELNGSDAPNGMRRQMARNKDNTTATQKDAVKIDHNDQSSGNNNTNRQNGIRNNRDKDEDILSILTNDNNEEMEKLSERDKSLGDMTGDEHGSQSGRSDHRQNIRGNRGNQGLIKGSSSDTQQANKRDGNSDEISIKKAGDSFDDEPNLEMLRQYVAVDCEITLLENKDALRVYHEKIEQLEQLERELDIISSEAEEMAVLSETETQSDRFQSPSVTDNQHNDSKMDVESNSLLSGVTGSVSHKSWGANNGSNNDNQGNNANSRENDASSNNNSNHNTNNSNALSNAQREKNKNQNQKTPTHVAKTGKKNATSGVGSDRQRRLNNASSTYSTVEEVFNRKIILEKERDKLKKEVEMVIIECDKLQQRYKKRDEILDKLFDGRTGNGLENHLEQQLNWLLEQKHYVDQVFYAWKRAETLTSQTCEQFASALELLKKLPKIKDPQQKAESARSIESLLVKSRQDMEQAQKYNPNVDAPFFTDNETERFDKIIETISSKSISPGDYSQILTVIQFAYKRAVSIRLWLEQILQNTIARDSFELAEEYKWIAIQLRKERISLIKSKLQDSPYQLMAQSVQGELANKQQALADKPQNEINRDSGVESETNDIDIEEEIYRLLELNKFRLAATTTSATTIAPGGDNSQARQPEQQLKVNGGKQQQQQNLAIGSSPQEAHKDQLMRDRIQKRVKGDQQLHMAQISGAEAVVAAAVLPLTGEQGKQLRARHANDDSSMDLAGGGPATPTKLKIELDEEARQTLLKQVDQIHIRHKSRIERLRGSTRAKATNSIMNRMQQARQTQPAHRTGS